LIGRRFPLAITLILAALVSSYLKMDTLTVMLGEAVAIVVVAYFQAMSQEKQTAAIVKEAAQEMKKVG
jgi:hypothetical protein